LQEILSCNGFENVFLGSLLDLAAKEKLVKHKVSLLEVENDVELTDLAM
jgi:hypothetical protein